jgi:hypothetical protein
MNRRGFLGMVVAGAAAITGVSALDMSRSVADVQAARRPTPTPKPKSCPGDQIPINGQCVCNPELDPARPIKCGSDCCPTLAECCDGACCYAPNVCVNGGGFGICVAPA